MTTFEAVIGLEVHAQLATQSKIFAPSGCDSNSTANTLCDPVTLGLPGALPVLNRRAVDFAIKLGLATGCSIRRESIFARKHYFYPDLPKGYQISQYEQPICEHGQVRVHVDGKAKSFRLTRIHLEEDAGKSIHLETEPKSLVDLNRAGVPLVEIVSEPDLRSAREASEYMRRLRQIVRYLGICDGNMEQGSLRCDANVSIRPWGSETLGTKVEIKNLNSFRFVEKAVEFEIARQTAVVQSGAQVVQETRLWDDAKMVTKLMRSKEYAEDYRYFPDPDLLPLVIDQSWIDRIEETLPELPDATYDRFVNSYGLDQDVSETLTEEKLMADYFDKAVALHNNPRSIANWITTELFGRLNREGLAFTDCPVSPENLATLVKRIDEDTISGKIAKTVFEEMFITTSSPNAVIEKRGLRQLSNADELKEIIGRIVEQHSQQAAEYREGKTKLLGFFVGQVMKETAGKANPGMVNEILRDLLNS